MQRLILITTFLLLFAYSLCFAGNTGEAWGIVSDAETGRPLSGVRMKVSGFEAVFVSDSTGSIHLEGLPQGSYIAEFSSIGYKTESAPLTITQSSHTCFVFRLSRLSVISPQVVVSADKGYSRSLEISGHSKALGGRELQQNLSQTIAATLKNEAGISITAMGAAPSRPIIRGLGGNRINFSEDGVKTNDLSGTSPDHAVAIDPFTIEKIEVVRGPKSLIGSGGASGGTVNIIKEIIPPAIPLRITAEGIAFAETSNSGLMGGAKTEIPWGTFAVKSDFSYRKSGNIGSPGKVLSKIGRAHV